MINVTALFGNTLPANNIHADNVLLVELLRPALWNPVLDLVLDHDLVRAFGEGLCQRLLVQLVELVVELGDHLLDVGAFLLGVDLLEDGDLHVLLGEEALLQERVVGLLLKNVLNLGVTITTQLRSVRLVDLGYHVGVHQEWCGLHAVLS